MSIILLLFIYAYASGMFFDFGKHFVANLVGLRTGCCSNTRTAAGGSKVSRLLSSRAPHTS